MRPERHPLAHALPRALPAAAVAIVAGCSLARPPAMVLAPHEAVVFGTVDRSGVASVGQVVKLYDQSEVTLYDSLLSDPAGRYSFLQAPAGGVMVKASSSDSLDFGYVRCQILRGSSTERDSIPPMDLRAHGCAPVSPADSSRVAVPSSSAPLLFQWVPVAGPTKLHYKVQLEDAADSTLWESAISTATTAVFFGVASLGGYAGVQVPPGSYSWRVKVHFASGVQAATRPRAITFLPAGAP